MTDRPALFQPAEARLLRWAEEKGGGIVSRQLRWRKALEHFAQVPWPDKAARDWIEAAREPEQLDALTTLMSRDASSPEHVITLTQGWRARLDDTGRAEAEWLAALAVLFRHLQEKGTATGFEKATGYLACCEEAADMGYGWGSLEEVVVQMLAQYGFEG